jgi:hypothetical protein
MIQNGFMHAAATRRPELDGLASDLQRVFAERLRSLVAYQDIADPQAVNTLALVESIRFGDLAACASMAPSWRRLGLEIPLMLTAEEFGRTLDVFPLEYGGIVATHSVIVGSNPFEGVQVAAADLRRACELQAKSHLIHLREGFLESGGHAPAVARLIAASSRALRTLVAHIERLDPGAAERAGVTDELVREIAAADQSTIADPTALMSRYVAAVERLWQQVDAWRA